MSTINVAMIGQGRPQSLLYDNFSIAFSIQRFADPTTTDQRSPKRNARVALAMRQCYTSRSKTGFLAGAYAPCRRDAAGHRRRALARTGLTDLRPIFECRHFDFGVNASDADRCVILVAPDFQPTYMGGCDLCAQLECVLARRWARPVHFAHLPIPAWVCLT